MYSKIFARYQVCHMTYHRKISSTNLHLSSHSTALGNLNKSKKTKPMTATALKVALNLKIAQQDLRRRYQFLKNL